MYRTCNKHQFTTGAVAWSVETFRSRTWIAVCEHPRYLTRTWVVLCQHSTEADARDCAGRRSAGVAIRH